MITVNGMEHKNNVWDSIITMTGGAIFTVIFGDTQITVMNFKFWQYSYEAILFTGKAMAGGLVAIFAKKAGEDIYNYVKEKYFKKK